MANFSGENITDSIFGGIGAALRGPGEKSNAQLRRSAESGAETDERIKDLETQADRRRAFEIDQRNDALSVFDKYQKDYEKNLKEEDHLKLGIAASEEQYGNFSLKPPSGTMQLLGFDEEMFKRREQQGQRNIMAQQSARMSTIQQGKALFSKSSAFLDKWNSGQSVSKDDWSLTRGASQTSGSSNKKQDEGGASNANP
tara:strand:- start:3 stop:599 length:597 start_codon:yes stop_codon:yes gene_type:complete